MRSLAPDGIANGGWRSTAFRGYADHALSEDFARGLAQLRDVAATRRTAMMCSEALWWRCHRRLIADRLVVAGDSVHHIGSNARTAAHRVTPFAVVGPGGEITCVAVDRGRNPRQPAEPRAAPCRGTRQP